MVNDDDDQCGHDVDAKEGLFVQLRGNRGWLSSQIGEVFWQKVSSGPDLPDETSAWQLAFVIIRQQPLENNEK